MNGARRSRRQHALIRLARVAAAAIVSAVWLLPTTPAFASEPVNGGGSTWSAVAIQQWQADVARQGLTVNYQATGSTTGRTGFINSQYDFAVSEIPFQARYCGDPNNPNNCSSELGNLKRPYLYMPIVAGGTSILYNLQVNGQRFTKLRLSPRTLTEIFTGKVTNWNAADIAADNPGVNFPNLAVTPVVRSDGSGTSYQFTAFMLGEAPDLWNAFCSAQSIATPCPPTSQFPAPNGYAAQSGSDGVANFVAAPYNNGAIGYAEAAYGIERGVPLASLKNASGVYAQPTAKAVAVGLTKAVINADHTQNLAGVYTNPDPRAYPMSSYSYMVVPTANPQGLSSPPMDLSKGATLSKFILYFLCQGQQEAAPLGYSPLPPNLVQLGFSVEQQIPGAVPAPPLAQCNNPTITDNFLADIGAPAIAGQQQSSSSGGASAKPSAGTTGVTKPSSTSGGTVAGSTQTTVVGGATSDGGPVSVSDPGPFPLVPGGGPGAVVALSGVPQKFGRTWRPANPAQAFLIVLTLVGCAVGPPIGGLMRRRRAEPSATSVFTRFSLRRQPPTPRSD